jgi:hypothetical protein
MCRFPIEWLELENDLKQVEAPIQELASLAEQPAALTRQSLTN